MLEFVLFVVVCALLYKVINQSSYRGFTVNLPPGRMGLPIVGESLQFICKKAKFFDERRKKHGHIYKTHLFGNPTIRISGKRNLEKLYAAENKLLQSAYPTSVWTILGKNTLSTSYGKDHADRKLQIMRCFSPAFFEQKLPEMSHFLTNRINDWCRIPQVPIFSELHSMFLELASVSLVSMDMPKSERARIQTLYHDVTDNLFTLPINLPGFGFHKALKAKEELKNVFLNRIKKDGKISCEQFPKVLENFVKAQNFAFEEDDLLNGIFELIFNAGETMSASAACVLCHLSQHPRVVEKLRDELSSVDLLTPPEENNNDAVNFSPEVLNKLSYLDCVYKETLRINPAIGGSYRKVLETFEMEGYTIPKGWTVVLGIRDTHQTDTELTDPSMFFPERWQDEDTSKLSFFTYASGARRCPGKGYASLVLKLFIVKLCQQCDFTLSEKNPEMVAMPTPRPKNNLTGNFVSRKLNQ